MTDAAAAETLSVVVEREVPFPPEKIWRAFTQPHLIAEWLMKNDFQPVVDHRFRLSVGLGFGGTAGRWRSSRTGRWPTAGAPMARQRRHLDPHADGAGTWPCMEQSASGRTSRIPTRAGVGAGRACSSPASCCVLAQLSAFFFTGSRPDLKISPRGRFCPYESPLTAGRQPICRASKLPACSAPGRSTDCSRARPRRATHCG